MGGREKEWLERSWVRNKGNLREAGDGGKGGLPPCPVFGMDVALAAADCGCSAPRPSGTASTGLMTFLGLPSLFLKVTLFSWSACAQLTGRVFLYKDTLRGLSLMSLANT